MFWRENFRPDFNEIQRELSVCHKKFRRVECDGKLLLLLLKVNCIKVDEVNV